MKNDHAWAIFVGTLLIAVWSCLVAFPARAVTVGEVAESPQTFAACKVVDVASTAYLLEHGLATESNPIVAWSLRTGGWAPLVFASIGIYWLMEKFKDEPGTKTGIAIANGVTCTAAAQNLLLLP